MSRCLPALILVLALGTVSLPLAAPRAAVAPVGVGPQTEILDLVPSDAYAAFGIRSVNDLRKKGDEFLKRAKLKRELRLSPLVTVAYTWLGIEGGVDEDRPVVLIAPGGAEEKFEHIVLAVPFTNLDKMASNFGFARGTLKPGTIMKSRREGKPSMYCSAQDNHLYLCQSEEGIKALKRKKPLGGELTAGYRKAVDGADIVLVIGPRAWEQVRKDAASEARNLFRPADEAEKKVAEQMASTLDAVSFFVGSARIDDGLSLRFLTVFQKKMPADAVAFLESLRAGPGASNLHGLPAGKVLVAHAASTDGALNATVAKLIVRDVFQTRTTASGLVWAADQPLITGVFSTLWRRFKGRRLALYRNEDEKKHGLFSVAGILDTDSPEKLMGEIAELEKFAKGKDLDLKAGSADRKAIEQLVRDLGADDYATREASTTRLLLVGEPAVELLDKAAESDDAEVRRRASRLLVAIRGRTNAQKKETIDTETAKMIRPGFVLKRAAETIDGYKVDVISVRLGKEDAPAVVLMRQLLGPEWDRVRMVTVGKQVVTLVGSDVGLLKKAVKNVTSGAAGLAGDRGLAAFHKQADPARKFELHVALDAVDALDGKGIDASKVKVGPLSSLAVTVDRGRLEVNLFAQPEHVSTVLRWTGLWD